MNGINLLNWSMRRRGNFKRLEEAYQENVLLCVEEGAFSFGVGSDVTGTAGFGDVVFCPPGVVLRRKAQTPFVTFLFAEFIPGEPSSLVVPVGKVTVSDTRRLASTFAGLWQLWPNNAPQGWAHHLIQDVLYLAASASGEISPRSHLTGASGFLPLATSVEPLMAEAAHLIQQAVDGHEPIVPVGSIARRLHLSPSQLTRRFAASWNLTPSEYKAALRLEKACTRLLETDETLEHIARSCGYRDGFYLSRVFRRQMGMPPSVFRKNSRV